MSVAVQKFNTSANRLVRQAQAEGKNITKAQVDTALKTLTADGRISKADRAAAEALLDKAPLTRGAKEELREFVKGNAKPTNDRSNNALNVRLRASTGGSESGRVRGGESGRTRTGGGESSGRTTREVIRRTGGGETPRRTSGGEWGGGGGFGGGYSRTGGGE